MNNIIEFQEIKKNFNGREIYPTPVNFKIQKFLKFGISGNSGVGKSTILKMIMGFVIPDSGNIYLENHLFNQNNVINFRKKCVWIPQSFNFIKNIEVINVIYDIFDFRNNQNLKPDLKDIQILFQDFNLSLDLLKSDINALSGGERQRLCCIIAILLKREIIILDEPTSNLDSDISDYVMDRFMSMKSTIIISSHDKKIINNCDNILEL